MDVNIGGESGNSNDYSLPSPDTLSQAGELHVLDERGEKVTFKSLYAPTDGVKRHLIIFIRHFSCGVSTTPSISLLPNPADCDSRSPVLRILRPHPRLPPTAQRHSGPPNHPHRLRPALRRALLPRPHSRALPHLLRPGPRPLRQAQYDLQSRRRRPEAQVHHRQHPLHHPHSFPNVLKSGFNFTSRGFNSGNFSQNGGEWLFVDGELKWCHIMQHTRDHAEIDELENILGFSHEASPAHDDATAKKG